MAKLQNHTIDCFTLVQAGSSKDLIAPKYFKSDKKAKSIFSFNTPEKVKDALMSGKVVSKLISINVLFLTFFHAITLVCHEWFE